MTTGYPQDGNNAESPPEADDKVNPGLTCSRCYPIGDAIVSCPDCTIERLAAHPGDRARLYAAFDRHAQRLLDHELDEHVREAAGGRRVQRIWST